MWVVLPVRMRVRKMLWKWAWVRDWRPLVPWRSVMFWVHVYMKTVLYERVVALAGIYGAETRGIIMQEWSKVEGFLKDLRISSSLANKNANNMYITRKLVIEQTSLRCRAYLSVNLWTSPNYTHLMVFFISIQMFNHKLVQTKCKWKKNSSKMFAHFSENMWK